MPIIARVSTLLTAIHPSSHYLHFYDEEELHHLPNSKALERAKLESQMRRWQDLNYEHGAVMGDNYDTIPNEADEMAYDALEKAYNAAFQVCSNEKINRFKLQQTRLNHQHER